MGPEDGTFGAIDCCDGRRLRPLREEDGPIWPSPPVDRSTHRTRSGPAARSRKAPQRHQSRLTDRLRRRSRRRADYRVSRRSSMRECCPPSTHDSQQKVAAPPARTMYGNGTVTAISPRTCKIGVSAGHDDAGNRRRVFRTVRGTKADALRLLADMRAEVGDGSRLATRDSHSMSVDELVQWYLVFARDERGLEHSTLTGYADVYNHWLKVARNLSRGLRQLSSILFCMSASRDGSLIQAAMGSLGGVGRRPWKRSGLAA